MKILKTIRKEKYKHILKLPNINFLNSLDFSKLIPKESKNVEVTYKQETGILTIDYVTILEINDKGE